ncbi:PI-PLC domain-containing protein [Actinoplanes sp. RD1]|uniref:hypothetical protein n=1 Tax=Actinoplanes sp. RD1 TaxID=3064538 RepID=UPI0027405F26|nr:hypothetical protein [Actinoplanes sp. RD1]
MREPLSPWWKQVQEAAQLLASRLNASVAQAARDGVYTPPPGAPAPRRRRQSASLRHLAEVIRADRLAPGMSVDKDDVAAVLAGELRAITDPVLVLAVARAAHQIARVPLDNAEADRLVVAATHVSALIDAARLADERAPGFVPVPRRPVHDQDPAPAQDREPAAEAPPPAGPVVIDAYFTTRRPGRRRAVIAGALGVLVLAGSAALMAFRNEEPAERPAAVSSTPTAAARTVTPLDHADAHDDHLNPRPLQDALDHGFTSLDVDVVLRDGSLVLCHHLDGDACADAGGGRITARPFDATYLQGLQSRVSAGGGRVYPGFHQQVLLFVEITCGTDAQGCELPADRAAAAADPHNPLVVAQAIMDALVPYRGMLFHVDGTARRWGPVQVVLTGDHTDDQLPASGGGTDSVRGLLARQSDRYAFLDGSLAVDLDQYNADLVPVITFPNPGSDNGCTGAGKTPIQDIHWDNVIKAQTTGHHVRVWDPKDCANRGDFWLDALYGGVDYLSTRHVAPLGDWLTTNAAGGGGGHCTVARWIAEARVSGHYCTLADSNVPVMSRPDPHSAPVGSLAKAGPTWFLGQQPGEPYPYKSLHSFWWAYTRADNGQWGWVSLVHFADPLLDQSADGLQYACYDARPGESADCHPL